MKLEELYNILQSTGYPVAYSHFDKPVKPPFIAYLVIGTTNFFADSETYLKVHDIQIELYTNKKDLKTENVLESVLDSNEIPYEVSETYIESEKLYQRIYEVSL